MKRIVQRLSLVVMLLLPMVMHGQETLIVADGTATSSNVPVWGLWADNPQKSQSIYPASMLTDMVGGQITEMHYFMSAGNRTFTTTWYVRLAVTSQSNLSSGFVSASTTTVYEGPITVSSTDGLTIVFDEPFVYNGGNLLVEFEQPISGSYTTTTFYGISQTNASRYGRGSGYTTSGGAVSFLPKVEFTYGNPASCDKPSNLAAVATPTTATISWTGAANVSAYSLYVADSHAANVASTSYVLNNLEPNTDYTVSVRSLCSAGDSTGVVTVSFHTPCEAKEIPLVNTFDNDSALDCWTMYASSASNSLGLWNGRFRFSSYASADNYNQYLFSPEVSETLPMQLSFDYGNQDPGDSIEYGYSSTGNAPANFTWVGLPNTNNTMKHFSTAIPAGTKYVAFHYNAESDRYYVYIDNFELTLPYVSGLAIDDVTADGATASWTPSPAGETSWQVLVVAAGDSADWSNAVTVTDTTYTITGLEGWSDYEVYVRPVINNTPMNEVTAAFMTLAPCEDGYQAAQFAYEGSETILQEVPFASNQYSFGASWQIFNVKELRQADKYILPGDIKGLAWNYSGPDSGEAIFSIYMANTSKSTFGNDSVDPAFDTMDRANMTLVYFDTMAFVNGWNEIKFQTPFYYNADSNLMVMVYRDYPVSIAGMAFSVNDGPSVQRFGYYYGNRLSSYSEKPYRNDTRYSMCYEIPSCYPVVDPHMTALRTATPMLVWETFPESEATGYEVIWDTVNSLDSALASGNSAIVSDTFYTFMNLDTNRTYYAWVRAICGEGDTSRWIAVDPFTTTNCQTVELPYCEYFEDYNTGVVPNCWYNYPDGTATVRANSSAYAGSQYLYFHGSYNNVITLPQPNAEIKNVTLSFALRPESYTNASCGTFSVGYMTDIEDTTTFVAMNTYNYNEFTGYEYISVHFQNAPTGSVFAFRANPRSTNWYWYVDNVCMDIAADNIYHTVLDTICIDAINSTYVWDHWNRNHTQMLYNLDTLDLSEFVGMPDGTTRTFVYDNGDTTEAVRLVMRQNILTYDTVAACVKYTWDINGETYEADTTVAYASEDKEPLANGCQMINGLVLTINQPSDTTFDVEACNFYVFEDTIRESGEYQRTISEGDMNGCDSIININLTIEYIDTIKDEATECYEYTWARNNETYTESGVYVHTEEIAGQICPNIYELTLTIHDTIFNVDTIEATGIYVAEDTTYINYNSNDDMLVDFTETLTAESTGCDSVIGTHLIVHPFGVVDYYVTSTMDTILWTVDEGRTYTIISDHDTVINRGYIYTEGPWAGRVGNINRLHFFRINPDTVCSGNEIEFNYFVTSEEPCSSCFDTASFTTDTVLNVISNKETENEPTTGDATGETTVGEGTGAEVAPVEGDAAAVAENCHKNIQDVRDTCFENNAVTDGVFYLDTMVDVHTRIIYHAMVNPSYDMMYDTTACDQFVWAEAEDSPVFTEDTLGVVRTFASVNGCDSVVTLNIHIDTTVLYAEEVSACGQYVWVDGEDTVQIITVSDEYTHTFEAATGCDSIVTLDVTVLPLPVNVIDTVVCEQFTLNNDVYTNEHHEFPRFDTVITVYDTLAGQAANGCDSIDQYNVTIKGRVDDTVTTVAIGSWYDPILGTTWFIPNDQPYLDTMYVYPDTLEMLGCDANFVRHLRVGYLAYIDQNEFGICGYYDWKKPWWDSLATDGVHHNGDYGWDHGYNHVRYWALDTINDANDIAHSDALYKYYEGDSTVYVYQFTQPRKLDSIYVVVLDGDSTVSIDINGVPTIYHNGDTLNNGFPVLWHLNLQLNMARVHDTFIYNYPISLLYNNDTTFNFSVPGAEDNDTTFVLSAIYGEGVTRIDTTLDTQWVSPELVYENYTDNLDPMYCGTFYRVHLQLVNDSVYDSVYICAYENQYLWIDGNNGDTIATIPAQFAYNTIYWSLTNDDFDNELTPDSIAILAYNAADFVLDTMITLHEGEYGDSATQKVYNLHLMQYPFVFVTDAVNACEAFVWERNGVEYTQPGVYNYTDTLPQYLNGSTCEFNYVLNLTTNYFVTDTTVCDSIVWHGNTYYESTVDTIVDPMDSIFVASDGTTCTKYYVLNAVVNYNVYTYVDTVCIKSATELTALKAEGFVKQSSETYYDVYFKDTVTAQTPTGCDSIDRHVMFHYTHPFVYNVDTVICEDDFATVSFFANGRTYSKPVNTNIVTVADTNYIQGCAPDTVYTGSITWSWSTYIFDTAASCGGEPYAWYYGHNYAPDSVIYVDSTGTYQYSIPVEGLDCPLASVLCFTMFDAEWDTVTIFHSQLPYLYEKHGIDTLLYAAGDYMRLKWDTVGIDTARYTNLHLEVLPYDTIMVIDSVCYNGTATYAAGEPITLHLADGTGDFTFVTLQDTAFNWADTSGAFQVNFFGYTVNADNEPIAEHLLMNTITVLDSHNIIIDTFSCSEFFWIYDEHTYTTDTIVTYTRESEIINPTSQYDIYGCPNRHTLILHILEYQEFYDTIETCVSYAIADTVITTSGDYDVLESMETGCNLMHHLNVTILEPSYTTIDTIACGYFLYRGILLTEDGVATYHYTAANGCDSVVTYNVTVRPMYNISLMVEACDSYTWNGTTYTQSGVYSDTVNVLGCDSITNLILTIKQSVNNTINVTACDSYVWDGVTYTTSGAYTNTYDAANGCDSVVTMNLTVNQSVTGSFSAVACNSYDWNGITYTTSGEYTQTFTAANGCDSVVTMSLTINLPVNVTIEDTACSSYEWNGISYTATGTYTQTFTAANGCDSIVTLNLVINQPVNVVLNETACEQYTWNGQVYTMSGLYTVVYTAANGCDSVVTLSLTVNQPVYSSFYDTAEYTYTWNGLEYSASGDYTYNYTAANGCDSIVTLHLTITGPLGNTIYIQAIPMLNGVVDTVIAYTHGTDWYQKGEVATLTAMVYPEYETQYKFVSWSTGEILPTIYITAEHDSTVYAYFEQILDIEDADATEVTIYSADSKIYVRGAQHMNVYVYDVTGRILREMTNATENVEFQMETTGVYLVKVGDAPAKRVVVVR